MRDTRIVAVSSSRRSNSYVRRCACLLALLLAWTAIGRGQAKSPDQPKSPDQSGTFVLHKFARAIGEESYSIAAADETYALTSHFQFTDRGSVVPLETSFVARTAGMVPQSYSAKGRSSREAAMDDALTVSAGSLTVRRGEHSMQVTPGAKPWFVVDGYSPVAMQEQMMRWWLSHGRPAEFTAYPAAVAIHIVPADDVTVSGVAMHGYTVGGLIWGEESLWMDDALNLTALVSTDAEFDHFEAVRQPYESALGTFIASAVRADLAALAALTHDVSAAPAKRLAIVGATLEDVSGAPAVPDSVILIENGVITAVGSRANVRVPKGATVLNAAGKYAIPGLWDMHAHYEQVEWGPIYLAAGVTTVRDCGNEFDYIRALHEELDRPTHAALGPHLEFAGIIDGVGPLTTGAVIADTPEQAQALVARYQAAGARQIKIYSSVKPEVVKAITAAAHARGMTVTGHIPVGMTALDGIHDGMDQINHVQYISAYFAHPVLGADGKPDKTKAPIEEPDGERAKTIVAAMKEHQTVLDPTMTVYEQFLHTEPLEELEPGLTHVAPQLREALETPAQTGSAADVSRARWRVMMDTVRALHAAGVPMVAGTDQSIPGYSLHRELEIYVEAGFTPMEALQAATIVPARALGVEHEAGSLGVGKRADVLLLDADPMADIHNTRRVWRTVAAGAVYTPAPLWQSVGFTP